MMWESVHVVRHHNIQSALRIVYFSDLEDLHVVSEHVTSHLEGSYINYFDFRIF